MRVSLEEGKAFQVGLFAGKRNFEEEMLPARSTRGRSRGAAAPCLSPLPPRPGSACPVRGSPLPGAFLCPLEPDAALAVLPAELRGRCSPAARRPAASTGELSSAASALFLPLSLPLAHSRLLRGFFSPTGPGGFPTRFPCKRRFLCDSGKPGPGPRRAGACESPLWWCSLVFSAGERFPKFFFSSLPAPPPAHILRPH